MNANDVIREAKLIYPVELFLPQEFMVGFVNEAREMVNKLSNLTYGEYSFQTEAEVWRYQLDKSFYNIYRAYVYVNNAMVPLQKIKEGEQIFRDKVNAFPLFYSFVPMDKITLYPCPADVYTVYLYGNIPLIFKYTINNMDTIDVIPDHYLPSLAMYVASKMAKYDQQYELARLFEEEFYTRMKEAKL